MHGAKGGSIIISAQEVSGPNEVLWLTLAGHKLDKKDTFGKSDPFVMLFRRNNDGR